MQYHLFGCDCKWKDPIISDNDKREHKLQEKANKIREQFAAYGLENLLRRVLDESIHKPIISYAHLFLLITDKRSRPIILAFNISLTGISLYFLDNFKAS